MRHSKHCMALFCASGLMILAAAPSRVWAVDPPVRPSDKAKRSVKNSELDIVEINLLEGIGNGRISADAEGMGDGRMTLSLTNRSSRQLRVVLPPGIIAQSATGQFGGMGGMGGGMMGGMGGGMGGMGGGMMGGMGGGMGGMGGGMDGRGGGGMGGMGGMGMRVGYNAIDDGNDDALSDDHVFLRRPESWDHAEHDDRDDGRRRNGGNGRRNDGRNGRRHGRDGRRYAVRATSELPTACSSPVKRGICRRVW